MMARGVHNNQRKMDIVVRLKIPDLRNNCITAGGNGLTSVVRPLMTIRSDIEFVASRR
jgi:hypothetical protein